MNHNFLFRGIACIVIGIAVLLSPRFLSSPGLGEAIAGSAPVGWFAIVLGVVLVIVQLTRGRRGGRRRRD